MNTIPRRGALLSPQEQLFLAHLSDGCEITDIADRTGADAGEIDEALRSAERKLGARNRLHAVATAMRLGVVTPRDFPA